MAKEVCFSRLHSRNHVPWFANQCTLACKEFFHHWDRQKMCRLINSGQKSKCTPLFTDPERVDCGKFTVKCTEAVVPPLESFCFLCVIQGQWKQISCITQGRSSAKRRVVHWIVAITTKTKPLFLLLLNWCISYVSIKNKAKKKWTNSSFPTEELQVSNIWFQ